MFVISANKTNQKGLCPLNCRITFNRKHKQFTTRLFVNPLNWQNKLQKISSSCINSKMHDGSFWSYRQLEKITQKTDLQVKAVNQFSSEEEFIENFKSAPEASRKTGVSKTCITRCCRGERKNSGGFLWKYI